MRNILALLVCMPMLVYAQFRAPSFTSSPKNSEDVYLGITITKDTVITLDCTQCISSAAITGQANLLDDTSHIRVLIRNSHNADYLVYENYSLLSESMSTQFSRMGMESIALNKIIPHSIVIEVTNAQLTIDCIHLSKATETETQYADRCYAIQKEQNTFIVNRLNENLVRQGKTWRAKDTSISRLTYEEKKDLFGGKVPKLYGFEYYGGGIFTIPQGAHRMVSTNSSSNCVDEWDWRNRHGKNWMTSVKNQGICKSCWAFAAVGTLEAYINLYYNRLLDYDLSEQELISCRNCGNCSNGSAIFAIGDIEQYGIVEEECFRYTARDTDCNNKCQSPHERIYVDSHEVVHNASEDSIKHLLFRSPIGIAIESWEHAVVLAGYRVIHAGDTISPASNSHETITIPSNSPLIGKTAWLIKNSWGSDTEWGEGGGYGHIVVDLSDIDSPYYLTGSIHSSFYSDADIICEDADGDGYYYWGVGPRPTTCPSWVPLEPDGDDSDYQKGPIDEFGWLTENNPDCRDTIHIANNTVWDRRMFLHNHICICEGATLTINNLIESYQNVSITISPNATLIVDGGVINKVTVKPTTNSNVKLINNGQITTAQDAQYSTPMGATMHISSGTVK